MTVPSCPLPTPMKQPGSVTALLAARVRLRAVARVLGRLVVAPQLGKVLLDVLGRDGLAALGELLEEGLELLLEVVVGHDTLDGAHAVDVAQGALAALVQAAAAVRRAVLRPLLRDGRLVRLLLF